MPENFGASPMAVEGGEAAKELRGSSDRTQQVNPTESGKGFFCLFRNLGRVKLWRWAVTQAQAQRICMWMRLAD